MDVVEIAAVVGITPQNLIQMDDLCGSEGKGHVKLTAKARGDHVRKPEPPSSQKWVKNGKTRDPGPKIDTGAATHPGKPTCGPGLLRRRVRPLRNCLSFALITLALTILPRAVRKGVTLLLREVGRACSSSDAHRVRAASRIIFCGAICLCEKFSEDLEDFRFSRPFSEVSS